MHMLRLATFDIGRKNFAHHVEDVALEGKDAIFSLETRYASLPRQLRRRVKGNMSPQISELLRLVCTSGTTVHQDVVDLRANPECKKLDLPTRNNLFTYLNRLFSLWQTYDLFIIEQQYFSTFTPKGRRGKKTEANIDAIKLGECCYAWFQIKFPLAEILFYGSQNKTQILGAPNSLSKYQRKKWAIGKMGELMELRGETKRLERLRQVKKRTRQKLDDVADCVVMAQAYKFQKMVACW